MTVKTKKLAEKFDIECSHSVIGAEYTLHQLAPYIGKVKSSIANFLIENFTSKGEMILDPFCGAGTIPFEAWSLNRNIAANDLNAYAVLLTKAKLFPPNSLIEVLTEIELLEREVLCNTAVVDLNDVPEWVKAFFHEETLKETIAWTSILLKKEKWFLLSCIMGILHHQRPGFLSFPSSHTVPYLRIKKYPKEIYPELYEYRNVKERLVKKVKRALKRSPSLDNNLTRLVFNEDASMLTIPGRQFDAIITSPPYMRQLDYARDNRLRLWFLGMKDYKLLDQRISPKESDFIQIISDCMYNWNMMLRSGGKCILFLGDSYSKKLNLTLPEIIENIATKQIGSFKLLFKHESLIPDNRRVRRNHIGNKAETILVFQKL